jgi:hypothetical protein
MRVFVDEHPVTVSTGATAIEAVAALDPDMQGAVERGSAYVTDGTGRVVMPATLVAAGSILRVVRSTLPGLKRRSDS